MRMTENRWLGLFVVVNIGISVATYPLGGAWWALLLAILIIEWSVVNHWRARQSGTRNTPR